MSLQVRVFRQVFPFCGIFRLEADPLGLEKTLFAVLDFSLETQLYMSGIRKYRFFLWVPLQIFILELVYYSSLIKERGKVNKGFVVCIQSNDNSWKNIKY